MTKARALYAARLYSQHHKALCVVYERAGNYLYDEVASSDQCPEGEVIAMFLAGKHLPSAPKL